MAKTSDVLAFLSNIGYEVDEKGEALIEGLLSATETTIKNQCNMLEIPTDLDKVVVIRTSGAFLRTKGATTDLTTTFDVGTAYKKITEGDTTVEIATPDSVAPKKLLNDYIKYLEEYGKRDVVAFRRVRW